MGNLSLPYREDGKGYNQLVLRTVGIIFTILGLLPGSIAPDQRWLMGFQWSAFAIFAYMLAEGLEKANYRGLYFGRLAFFASLTEVPYNLFVGGSIDNPFYQSAMFTLLIGYIMILCVDFIKKRFNNMIITFAAMVAFTLLGDYLITGLRCQFSSYGMYIIMIFYVFRHVRYGGILATISVIYIAFYVSTISYTTIKISGIQYIISPQSFVLVGMLFTRFYSGKRGPNSLTIRYASYLFYPVALLLLYFMKKLGVSI